MRKLVFLRTDSFLSGALVLLGLLASAGQTSAGSADKRVDLVTMVGAGSIPVAESSPAISLSPQWVGTIKEVFSNYPYQSDHKESPNNLRINMAWRDRENRLVIARSTSGGQYLGSEAAVYLKELPSTQEVRSVRTLDQLRKWFGPQHGWTDRTIGERVGWTQQWVYFTLVSRNKIRWQGVFAHVSAKADQIKDENTSVDILSISEGTLHPADPGSVGERARYRTAEEIEAEREQSLEQKRGLLPQPLQALVVARETPGDSELKAYSQALSEIRRDPDSLLFQQLAERISEGTLAMRSLLEDIILDNASFLKVAPWLPAKRIRALSMTVAAFKKADTPSGLKDLGRIVMDGLGGGTVLVKGQGDRPLLHMDISHSNASDSGAFTYHSSSITSENLRQSADQISKWFRQQYPQLGSD